MKKHLLHHLFLLALLAYSVSYYSQQVTVTSTGYQSFPRSWGHYYLDRSPFSVIQTYDDHFLVIIKNNDNKTYLECPSCIAKVDHNMEVLGKVEMPLVRGIIQNSQQFWIGHTVHFVYLAKIGTELPYIQHQAYDCDEMKLLKNEKLFQSQQLTHKTERSIYLWDMCSFSHMSLIESPEKQYTGLLTYQNERPSKAFNLFLYDKDFNLLAEQQLIDTFQLRGFDERKEILNNGKDYLFDLAVSDEGKAYMIRTIQSYYANQNGADIAVYELSNNGFRTCEVGHLLGTNDFHSLTIVQTKDDEVVAFGVYSNQAPIEDYRFYGICTFKCNLADGTSQVIDKKEFSTPLLGSYKSDRFTDYRVHVWEHSLKNDSTIWADAFTITLNSDMSIKDIQTRVEDTPCNLNFSYKGYEFCYNTVDPKDKNKLFAPQSKLLHYTDDEGNHYTHELDDPLPLPVSFIKENKFIFIREGSKYCIWTVDVDKP